MKKTKVRISIGISAYNEEKNIAQLLAAILRQTYTFGELTEILIYCDGCSDDTAKLAKGIKDKRILVIDDGKRKGKVGRVQQACREFRGDILVILDADIAFHNNNVIDALVPPFTDRRVMLVGGNTRPFSPTTFFERSVYSTFMVFDASRKYLKNGNNIFGCTGACIALRKSFAKSVVFPNVINEDDFVYFSCLSKGYLFQHVPAAIVYYKLPKTLRDYLKQVFRSNPEAVAQNFTKHFGNLVSSEYKRPVGFYLMHILRVFLRYPLEVIYITCINALCKPFYSRISRAYKLSWYTATSTK